MILSRMRMGAASVVAAGLAVVGLAMLSPGVPGAPPPMPPPSDSGIPTAPQSPGPQPNPDVAGAPASRSPQGQAVEAEVIAVGDPDGKRVWAVNTRTRAWYAYKAPAGTKVRPFDTRTFGRGEARRAFTGRGEGQGGLFKSESVAFVALDFQGEKITELAAFSPKAGGWVRQALHGPASGRGGPVLGDEQFALYTINGRRAYAFSALTGTWDSVDLGENTRGPYVEKLPTPGMAVVKGSGPMYAYDARAGRFRDLESDGK